MRRALAVLALCLVALGADGGSIEIITPGGGGGGGLSEADANALYCLINGCTSPTAFTVKTSETKPGAPTVALAGAGAGNLTAGVYSYKITFITASGETEGGTTSATVTVVNAATNGKVALSAIPTGSNLVTSRKIYRTIHDGSQHKLVATLADNSTTTYTDNIADASLTTNAPTVSTAADARLTVANSGAVTASGAVTTPGLTLGATAITADGTELNYVDGVTSAIQPQINTKAPTASPTFTGTVTGPGYTAAQSLGTELSTQTCAGWGLAAPVGAWSCSGSTITRTASGANLTITNVAAVALSTYQVTIVTATVTAGSVTASMGGTSGTAITTATTTTEYLTASATTALTLTASATFAGTITITTSGAKLQAPSVTNDTGPLIFKSAGSIRLIPAATYEVLAFGSLRMASGTSIYAPIIDSGAATNLLLKYNGTTMLTVGNYTLAVGGATMTFNGNSGITGALAQVGELADVDQSTAAGGVGGTYITNNFTANRTVTLLSAITGYHHSFIDSDSASRLTIKPASGDEIIWTDGTVVSAATGSIVFGTRYQSLELVAISATTWVVTSTQARGGTFTVTP